jgi:hypothetical protein
VAATLYDAFNNAAVVWPGVTATVAAVDSGALSGPALTGYADGAAVFNSTTLRGPVGSTHSLSVVLASSELNGIVTSQVGNVNVTIAPCATNEEFQDSSSLCVCSAGYAPTISSGCVACAPGTYAPAAGSSRCSVCASGAVSGVAASSCTSCPANSVVAANQCACAVGYYDANFGASAVAPLCTECPLGATCTTGTLGAAVGFWREALNDTVFLACREGNLARCKWLRARGARLSDLNVDGNRRVSISVLRQRHILLFMFVLSTFKKKSYFLLAILKS